MPDPTGQARHRHARHRHAPRASRTWSAARPFLGGVAAIVAVLALATGVTWASPASTGPVEREGSLAPVRAEAGAGPAPGRAGRSAVTRTVEGPAVCALAVGGENRPLSAAQARTMTMLAALGHRVAARDRHVAHAVDVALADPRWLQPSVTDALDLLTRTGGQAPSKENLAAVRALAKPARLTCRWPELSLAQQQMRETGLTGRAEVLRTNLEDALGELALGGFAPGGVREGHTPGSAHYEGRAIDIMFRPVTPTNQAAGWLVAHWLTARGDTYEIHVVIFDDQIWSTTRSEEGWRPYTHPSGDTTNPILRHLDHVHVDVAEGR